jgi:hypothetical protein
MEMLLLGACLSMFGLAVACLAFGAATRDADSTPATQPAVQEEAVRPAVPKTRFFVDRPTLPIAARNPVPIEALLLQIENHVRLEQAAAESFLASPNSSLLHSRTASPFVN